MGKFGTDLLPLDSRTQYMGPRIGLQGIQQLVARRDKIVFDVSWVLSNLTPKEIRAEFSRLSSERPYSVGSEELMRHMAPISKARRKSANRRKLRRNILALASMAMG